MDRVADLPGSERLDGEVVHADELYSVLHAPLGARSVERDEVLVERVVRWPVRAVARLEEHPLRAARDACLLEPRCRDVIVAVVSDDAARADERVHRQ